MTTNQNWKQCPEGTLNAVQDEQKRRAESSVMSRRVALGALITAGVAGGVLVGQSGPKAKPLTCVAAMKMAPEYIAKTLDAQDVVSVDAHLGHCPMCRRKYDELEKRANV